MSTEPRTDSRWEPTWGRLAGTTIVLFLVILAFLVGRVRAGADPGLARETTGAPTQQVAPPAAGSGADPSDPFAQPQSDPGVDPGANGTTDNFGNAVPGPSGGQGDGDDQGDNGGAPGSDPPSTHVS
jgi:hypothetical protein